MGKIKNFFATAKNVIEFEIMSNLETLKRLDSWMVILALLTAFFIIIKNNNMALICLVIIIILQMKRDYDDGNVTAYLRQKKGYKKPSQLKKELNNATNENTQEPLEISEKVQEVQ
jgi:hypothetical protein